LLLLAAACCCLLLLASACCCLLLLAALLLCCTPAAAALQEESTRFGDSSNPCEETQRDNTKENRNKTENAGSKGTTWAFVSGNFLLHFSVKQK